MNRLTKLAGVVKEDTNTDIVNKLKKISYAIDHIQRYEIETWPEYEDEGGGWYLDRVNDLHTPHDEDLVKWEDVKKIKQLLQKTIQEIGR
jgi:hypothetical protein